MPYKILYNKDLNYVEVISVGEFTIEGYKTQIEEVARYGKKYKAFRFLVNNLQLVNKASITDIYQIPHLYRASVPEKDLKLAALFSDTSHNKDSVSFYENICVNQGLNIKTFYNRKKALTWLLSD